MAYKDMNCATNVRPAGTEAITVSLPNGAAASSDHIGEITIADHTFQVHFFREFPVSLISIGLLCATGFTVEFSNDRVTFKKGDISVLEGPRDTSSGLWSIDLNSGRTFLENLRQHSANAILSRMPAADLVAHFHEVMGTMEQAIAKGYLRSFPGLTLAKFRKHRPHTIPTALGHLNQSRQGQQTTKKLLKKGHSAIYYKVWEPRTDAEAADFTGYFPVASAAGTRCCSNPARVPPLSTFARPTKLTTVFGLSTGCDRAT